MNSLFKEIFERLDNIEKVINPIVHSEVPLILEKQGKQSDLVKISVASRLIGYSTEYVYHLVRKRTIPFVRQGRHLRFDVNELEQWLEQQYVKGISDEKEER
ncbi:helix-turn-helix domain-containing protein [Dysgonomonas sp. Marseille-P4677]|uniref:helix-turn-helix domain-containing protein n=1 Tax=Dysgonomonas sp. Marseille-P4677 TaxID=2364790 RepID=UPI001913F081|nr:helix-turn-helix domain-containing protein [Dysgonomonas sp. Marseille-P4677]MBK5721461.1 helix-turn-helix domain-containing protein [Dysgonomonas sp. Marseille-P4677]